MNVLKQNTMKCTLCGHEFDPRDARSACEGCGLVKNCELVRCPNCNFELAPTPKWLEKLKRRLTPSGTETQD